MTVVELFVVSALHFWRWRGRDTWCAFTEGNSIKYVSIETSNRSLFKTFHQMFIVNLGKGVFNKNLFDVLN